MTVQEIADQLVHYCRTGQSDEAYPNLFSDDAVSIEMEGAQGFPQRTEGIEAMQQKGKMWEEMVEEFHGMEVEEPIVSGNHFSVGFKMDITMKGQPRRVDEEIAIYRVENGKIVSEQFFYALE
ncbi:MAG: nuclear transport factor 2 family protein [Bacteroidota bacterium]